MTRTPNRTSRRIRRRTCASAAASTRWRLRPTAPSGERCSASLAPWSGSTRARIRPRQRWPRSTSRRSKPEDSLRAAVTSIATASTGRRWPAGIMGSFDRRKCKAPLNGPKATGLHCPEGWTFYPEPLPQIQGVTTPGSAEGSYYTWVDWFDTSGLGPNTPINTGNLSEGLLALKDGKWVVHARPVSARVLHEVARRPHRRSEGGMEGQRTLGHVQHAGRRSTWKRGRAPRARSTSSRSGRIRWRSEDAELAGSRVRGSGFGGTQRQRAAGLCLLPLSTPVRTREPANRDRPSTVP